MEKLRLVHWNEAEAEERAGRLRELGYDVEAGPPLPPLRRFAEGMRAVVIDLSRLPSQGRDVGVAVRVAKSTRSVPIVFVGGLPEKIERVRQTLPSRHGAQIGPTLRRVRPPRNPVVPSPARRRKLGMVATRLRSCDRHQPRSRDFSANGR